MVAQTELAPKVVDNKYIIHVLSNDNGAYESETDKLEDQNYSVDKENIASTDDVIENKNNKDLEPNQNNELEKSSLELKPLSKSEDKIFINSGDDFKDVEIINGNDLPSKGESNLEEGYINPVFKGDENSYQLRPTLTDQNNIEQDNTTSEQNNTKKVKIEKLEYGWGCITNKYIKKLNTPLFFLIILCLAALAQGLVVTGIAFTVITSIEKQFGLTSTEVGLFGTSYDIAYGICCLFVGYVGHRHKPRWIALGGLLMAVAAFVFTIPKYIYGPYLEGDMNQEYCRTFGNTTLPEECEGTTDWYNKFFFFLSNILMGIGAIPLATLGTAHLDEIAVPSQSGLYIAFFYASAVVGPGLGFIIGLPILETWVDIEKPASVAHLTTEDRNWVGAWWLGYLIGAAFLLTPAIPMLGFSRTFKNTESVREKKLKLSDAVKEDKNLQHDLKSAWPATKALFKNTTFIFICLGGASETLAISGFSTFISKFIETQFHFTSSNASLYTGIIILPGAACGILVGGYLMKRYTWSCKKTLKISSFIAFLGIIPILSALIGCNGRDIVGASVPYFGGDPEKMNLTNVCNMNCDCTSKYYKPICFEEKQETYFSPCHAGCQKENQIGDNFYNCTCIIHASPNAYAKEGRCSADCDYFPYFAIGMFLMIAVGFVNNVPILQCVFRVVPEGQGSFAMGFQQVFIRFLGFIPAPTVFGKLIDTSCNLWQVDECTGESLNCLEYENADFRMNLFILGCATKFFTFLFIYLAYKSYDLPEKDDTVTTNGTHPPSTPEVRDTYQSPAL